MSCVEWFDKTSSGDENVFKKIKYWFNSIIQRPPSSWTDLIILNLRAGGSIFCDSLFTSNNRKECCDSLISLNVIWISREIGNKNKNLCAFTYYFLIINLIWNKTEKTRDILYIPHLK
jgi:hypothetical protein